MRARRKRFFEVMMERIEPGGEARPGGSTLIRQAKKPKGEMQRDRQTQVSPLTVMARTGRTSKHRENESS